MNEACPITIPALIKIHRSNFALINKHKPGIEWNLSPDSSLSPTPRGLPLAMSRDRDDFLTIGNQSSAFEGRRGTVGSRGGFWLLQGFKVRAEASRDVRRADITISLSITLGVSLPPRMTTVLLIQFQLINLSVTVWPCLYLPSFVSLFLSASQCLSTKQLCLALC